MERQWDEDQLRMAWQRALSAIGASAEEGAFDDLMRRYAQPHRHYHSVAHVSYVVATVSALSHICGDAATTMLAGFYHDAIYEIGSSDNEVASAELAATALRRWGAPMQAAERVAQLVQATKDHAVPPGLHDAAVLVDADLAVLASDPPRYDEYVRQVRREYQAIPEDLWRAGRSAVLESFLTRDRIYLTSVGREWESRARHNMARELTALRGAPT